MKRRAIVRISPELLKERLFLPGEILDAQAMPSYVKRLGKECEYIAFKLQGPDLPEVREGSEIPVITIGLEKARAYWEQEDGEKHYLA